MYVAHRYRQLLENAGPRPAPIAPIENFSPQFDTMREVNLIDRRGEVVASSVTPRPPTTNVFDRPIFQWHRSNSTTALVVHPPTRSRFRGSWLLLLSRRADLPDGQFGGTVSVQIDPREMTNFLRNATLGDSDVVSVIGLDGFTRARRTGKAVGFGQDIRGTLLMKMQVRNPNSTYLGPSPFDGVVRYYSHRSLPKYNLFVTSGVAEATVLGPLRFRASAYVSGAALLSLGTMFAAWLVLTLISQRTRREAEARVTSARLRQSQLLAKLGDWSFDVLREQFHWSADLCAMYERPSFEQTIALRDFGEIAGKKHMQAFKASLEKMRFSSQQQEIELAVRLPSGTVSHRRIVAVPDYDGAGRLIAVHGTDQDITSRKLLESLRQQVSHLSRVDALNAITSTLAHELNQPLAAASNYLSGSVRLLSQDANSQRAVLSEALEATRDQILHAGDIVRSARRLVSARRAGVESTSLHEAVRGAVAICEAARPGIVVVPCRLSPEEDFQVLADPVQLQQILTNLINNARESCMPREPVITIRARHIDHAMVEVFVSDDGPGIQEPDTDIFSAFATSKGEGLGLGLAICRTLVEAMGGRIAVAETGPTGTSMCFTLPDASAKNSASHAVLDCPD